jgi:hemerythrin-like domain-containing protein
MLEGFALWNRDHANFAVLLDLFERQLDLFHEGESPDYDLMSDIMFYMTHYSDLVHHPREDLAFARIKEREPGAVDAVVDELAAQHVVLKQAGEALIHALDDIVNGSITSRDHLEVPARKYLETFRGHMEREETTLLPLVQSLLRQRDWSAIDAEISHIEDPVFGRNFDERYAALRAQIAREAHISASAALR